MRCFDHALRWWNIHSTIAAIIVMYTILLVSEKWRLPGEFNITTVGVVVASLKHLPQHLHNPHFVFLIFSPVFQFDFLFLALNFMLTKPPSTLRRYFMKDYTDFSITTLLFFSRFHFSLHSMANATTCVHVIINASWLYTMYMYVCKSVCVCVREREITWECQPDVHMRAYLYILNTIHTCFIPRLFPVDTTCAWSRAGSWKEWTL